MKQLSFILLFIGFSSASIYVFDSGLPQPADFVLSLFMASIFVGAASATKRRAVALVPLSWILLTVWITLCCIVWALILQDISFVRHAIFWIYNTSLACAFLTFINEYRVSRRSIALIFCAAIFVSGIGVGLDIVSQVRVRGFFNNPNQLAYFSLCCLGAILVLTKFRPFNSPVFLAALGVGVLSVLVSASISAILALGFLTLSILFSNALSFRQLVVSALALFIVAGGILVANQLAGGNVFEILQTRQGRLDAKLENMYSERGYERIVNFPEYLFLGAGEEARERFQPFGHLEIHSSYGNILFSYGLVGLALFFMLLISVLHRASLSLWMVACAPLLYSVTHMGLRFTAFWLLLAIIYASPSWERLEGKPGAARQPSSRKKKGLRPIPAPAD